MEMKFAIPLTNNDRIFVEFKTDRGQVITFIVKLICDIQGYRPLLQHGIQFRHTLTSVIEHADLRSYCSREEVCLVYFQLSKAFFRQLELVGKDPVHHRDQLAELVSIMVGVSFLF